MKKIFLFLATSFLLSSQLLAQQDVRNTETIIADVLKRLPAENEIDLNKAMQTMEKLGEDGFYRLTTKLGTYGKKDVAHEQYAIMGYTTYVSAPGRESLKNAVEKALIKAAQENADIDNKTFFMDMLEIVGTNQSVAPMQALLSDKNLAYKAANVLTAIGTPEAGNALLTALSAPNSQAADKPSIVQALGIMQFAPAISYLSSLVTSQNSDLKDIAIKALVNIGDPSSSALLLKETASFGNLDNTALYGRYIGQLAANGNTKEASSLADALVKKTKKAPTLAKIAALQALTNAKGEGAIKTLANAAFSKDLEYSGAALQLAGPLVNASNISLFTNKKNLLKASPAVLPGIIGFLGNNGGNSALSTISKLALSSSNAGVQSAAIMSLAKLGGSNALPTLLSLMNSGNSSIIPTVQKALQLMPASALSSSLVGQLAGASGAQKAALIDVLGSKGVSTALPSIIGGLSSNDGLVKSAAFAALPQVADQQSLPQLFSLLGTVSDAGEVNSIQQAISGVLSQSSDPESVILSQLTKIPLGKQALLLPLLSKFGSSAGLEKVMSLYQSGNGSISQNALKALTSWSSPVALNTLASIVTDSKNAPADRAAALTNYINLIPRAEVPEEQKLLMYEKAMSEASNANQKKQILGGVSNINTFPALAFAAGYLDDNSVANNAAGAVINIGMSSNRFYGTLVRQWLTKAADILTGQDDVYTKKAVQKFLDDMPQKEGYVSMFNGKDLAGWKGLVENPIARSKMTRAQLDKAQLKADSIMRRDWVVENGDMVYVGHGYENITSMKKYGNFEMLVDWKIFDDGQKNGDAGIYLRGTPQVQMWDTSRVKDGAQVGSGGLYNNQKHRSTPLKVADNPLGEWNHFYIKMVGDNVTVYLNGELVTDNIPLENYWDRKMPLFPEEQIELQAHGSKVGYRNIYIRELPNDKPFELSDQEKAEGYQVLFNGKDLDNWVGNKIDYVVEDGMIVIRPQHGNHGNLYTDKEYGDFSYKFDFKLTPGANNGIGIRAPLEGDAAYQGMEIQVLDNTADIYKDLQKYQYHGSVYGVIPAKRGYLNPVGDWNHEEIIAKGDRITVILNGEIIVDGDIRKAAPNGKTMDGNQHPGLFNKKGHIGFLGHGDVVFFRNIRIKEL